MKYASKQALIDDIRAERESLIALLAQIPRARWGESGVWGDRWTIIDLVAHLAEWQRMFLRWYADGLRGVTPEMPAPGFKWSETPRLNRTIRERNRSRSASAVRRDFDRGYARILQVVDGLSPKQLLEPGPFSWTGTHPLTTYIGPNTASHYRFAKKVITRWLKRSADGSASAVAARPVVRRARRP